VYNIYSANSSYVVDVASQSVADGAYVLLWPLDGGNNQRWRLEQASSSDPVPWYRIININSEKLLAVENASLSTNAPVFQYSQGTADNEWWSTAQYNAACIITNKLSGLLLTAQSLNQGAGLIQATSSDDINQQWIFVKST